MKRFVLKNGLTVLLKQRPTSSVAIDVTVKIGSNDEPSRLRGISHFIEHMLFEGTKKRSAQQIANEIESIGGDINALTTSERTSYYVVVLSKYFDLALDVLADLIQNPLFDEKMVDKERSVILDEINLTTDDPKIHQWILFQKTLYEKHPCRNPIYGTRETVTNLKRKELVDFYSKYYVPNNIVISVVGNVDKEVMKKIGKAFSLTKKSFLKRKRIVEPKKAKPLKFVEKRKISHSYMVFGCKAVPRNHPDSFVFDIIRAILGRGQSSKLFQEIRTKRGLAYSVGFHYEAGTDYGWVAVYVGTDKKNIKKIKNIILKEIQGLSNISDEDLKDAINFIEGDYLLSNENNHVLANTMCEWELVGKPNLVEDYIKKIKKVRKIDIKKIVDNYLKNFTHIIIRQV
ncbi:MAG: insulinase family protein [Nanoarchaeota archaeon]|nr:insulinase family protein [Nanoarchaeota archaeon]